MEIQLILGANSSGKSKYAEDLAVAAGGPRVYLATMVPQNEENLQRIEKHRLQRQDKGFRTVEEPWNINGIAVEPETVVLLEDVSNLLANGMFDHGADAQQALERILTLARHCRALIVVSISGLVDEGYDGQTARYIEQLNWLNEQLRQVAVRTVKMQGGLPVEIQDGIPVKFEKFPPAIPTKNVLTQKEQRARITTYNSI